MKLAILGAGYIANLVSPTLRKLDEIECYAIAARDLDRAKQHAEKHGFQKAYGSYEEMLSDPEVELVYIATPSSHHYEHIMMSLQAGKHVLCEKTFTMNAKEARAAMEYARAHNLYLGDAVWTRYMPSRTMLNDILESGIIGTPRALTANLSYVIERSRILRPELAGGALLDLGIYGLNFALMHFGDDIVNVESAVQMTDTGVDGSETIILQYKDGRMATLTHGIFARSDRMGIIYGDKGYLVVKTINNPKTISVYDMTDTLLAHYHVPEQISGYEYEFRETVRCIREGKLESDSMPHKDTLQLIELMDRIRARWGLVFPVELQ